jgi:hypothetical protein
MMSELAVPTLRTPAIEAVLNYVDPTAEIGAHNDVERRKSTLTLVPYRLPIRDARPVADDLSLETLGFALLERPSRVADFFDPAQVEATYLAEIEALIAELTGCDRVLTFGTVVRNDAPDAPEGSRKPVYNAHIDYDLPTIRAVAHKMLPPAERARYAHGRIALINVWRPITQVESAPLAVCDGSSVRPEDLIFGPIGGKSVADVPNAAGYNLAYNPDHRWYYVPDMRPDELLAFKLCDSEADRVQWAAHTAFHDPNSRPGARGRQSIELRTLALFAT